MAQEPAICGDWIGAYKNDVDSEGSKNIIQKDYKRYIRIKLIDGSYTVRMKTRTRPKGTLALVRTPKFLNPRNFLHLKKSCKFLQSSCAPTE